MDRVIGTIRYRSQGSNLDLPFFVLCRNITYVMYGFCNFAITNTGRGYDECF